MADINDELFEALTGIPAGPTSEEFFKAIERGFLEDVRPIVAKAGEPEVTSDDSGISVTWRWATAAVVVAYRDGLYELSSGKFVASVNFADDTSRSKARPLVIESLKSQLIQQLKLGKSTA